VFVGVGSSVGVDVTPDSGVDVGVGV
jgi:hypothetical protein